MDIAQTEHTGKTAKGDMTRQRLFEAARRLYSECEFSSVTVERIAREARVAKGTFYIYFESKDALVAALVSENVHRVDSDYRSVAADCTPDAPAGEILLALIEKIADKLTEVAGRQVMSTIYKLLLSERSGADSVKDYDRDLYYLFAALIERGIQSGEFETPLSPESTARHFVMAMRGLTYEWCIRYPDFDLKAQAAAHFQILINGIRVRQ